MFKKSIFKKNFYFLLVIPILIFLFTQPEFCLAAESTTAGIGICTGKEVKVEAGVPLTLKLSQPFGELKPTIEIKETALGDYIKAIYVFGTAAVAVIAVIMIMIGGLQWIIYGTSDKIAKAKETITKSLLGLIIALFAVFMLQLVNPGAVNFSSISPSAVSSLPCCEIKQPDGNCKFEFKKAEECKKDSGITVATEECIKVASKIGSPIANSSKCANYKTCTECTADSACKWIPANSQQPSPCDSPHNGQCIAKSTDNISPINKTLQCVNNKNPSDCQANASLNCVWASKFCSLNANLINNPPATDACKSIVKKSDCDQNGNCQWYNFGCTDQETLAEQFNKLECTKRVNDNCTTYKCYWQSIGCSGNNCCREIVSFGEDCQSDEDCGEAIGFCNKGSINLINGKCEALRNINQDCANVCGYLGPCDAACKSKNCNVELGFKCFY